MRELTCQEMDGLSGGNEIALALGIGVAVGGTIAGLDYALNGGSFSGFGLTMSVAQGGITGALTTGGTILLTIPGGAAAAIPALALAAIIETTDPLASIPD